MNYSIVFVPDVAAVAGTMYACWRVMTDSRAHHHCCAVTAAVVVVVVYVGGDSKSCHMTYCVDRPDWWKL